MILNLPRVTLFGIDTVRPDRTIKMMEFSQKHVKFGRVVLLTDKERFPGLKPSGFEVFHTTQRDRKESPQNMPKSFFYPDYERDNLVKSADYCETDFQIHIEWDSAVLNPNAWCPEFMDFDYIGAPWPDHNDPGWPSCDSSNNVGNGGFSMKSKRFCQLVKKKYLENPSDPGTIISDSWMCRTIRHWLEKEGMIFAPADLAYDFSCENQIYSGQFGFHGKWTAALNNWGALFGNVR